MVTETRTSHPLAEWLRQTARAFGLVLKAIGAWFLFCTIGAFVAPLVFVGLMIGMFPNILAAVFSFVITIPLLFALPFHAIYAAGRIFTGGTPDYARGVYGAVEWVEKKRIYDPTEKVRWR